MSKIVGDIAVQVGADVSPLQRDMSRASGSVKGFERNFATSARSIAKVGAGIALVSTGIVVGLAAVVKKQLDVVEALADTAAQANTTVSAMQKLTFAGTQNAATADEVQKALMRLTAEMSALATGGTSLAAKALEEVGIAALDAEGQLRSSSDVMLDVAERMQGMASDADKTALAVELFGAKLGPRLMPMLRLGRDGIEELGRKAEDMGLILDDVAVNKAAAVNAQFRAMAESISMRATAAVVEHADQIQELADFIMDKALPALIEFGTWFFNLAEDIGDAVKSLNEFSAAVLGLPIFGDGVDPGIPTGGFGGPGLNPENLTAAGREFLGLPALAPEEDPRFIGPIAPMQITISTPRRDGPASDDRRQGGGGGGGKARDFEAEMQDLRDRFATEFEIIDTEMARQLARLEEFRAQKIATDEEYNDLEERIRQDHADKMQAIEVAAQQARMQAVSGALGDLSSLMASENKKLFKVGQAAALAEAVVSGYSAAVAAWDKGMKIGGPGLAAAFTGASLAKTGMLISQIKGASPTGGGGQNNVGGSGAPSESASDGGGQRAAVSLTLIGDQGFSRAQIVQIAEAMNEATGDGSQPILNIRGRR